MKLALETTVNACEGYTNTDALTLATDMVAFPLTSFRPASRNMISRESIKRYDCATKLPSKFTRKKNLNCPGLTATLMVKAFETVGENTSAVYVPTSKKISLTPARHKKSGPAMMLELLGLWMNVNSNGVPRSHDVEEKLDNCSSLRACAL